jgi:hypothetical protein
MLRRWRVIHRTLRGRGLFLFRRKRLPAAWAPLVLEIDAYLLVWRDAEFAVRADDGQHCQDLL